MITTYMANQLVQTLVQSTGLSVCILSNTFAAKILIFGLPVSLGDLYLFILGNLPDSRLPNTLNIWPSGEISPNIDGLFVNDSVHVQKND